MKKFLAALLVLISTGADAQNYLRDDGIFHSVVEGTTNGQLLQNQSGLLGGINAASLPITVGSTVIASGTDKGLLYDNAGVLGNLATLNNGILGTGATGVPAITVSQPLIAQAGNPGNAGLAFTVPNAPVGFSTLYNGIQVTMGDVFPATYQYAGNLSPIQQALVGAVTIAAGEISNSQANGIAGYCRTYSGVPTNCVAVFGQSSAQIDNASVFGADIIAENINKSGSGGAYNLNYMAGMEINPNLWQNNGVNPTVNSNHFYGINIQGGGNHTNEIGSAIVVNNAYAAGTTRWATAYESIAGAAITGVSLGQAVLGNSQGSQTLNFLSKNGAGSLLTASMFSDANGALYVNPAPASAFFVFDGSGNTLAQFQTAGAIGGNTGFQLNQVAAIGVLKTSAAGVVSSSLTLPTGLSAPAFTVTGSFTATGLVTNADLVNAATTVNGQTCTLGSTCTVTAAATSITVGSTTIGSGTTTRVLFDNAGTLGEYVISGSGNVAMTTNPVFTTPNLGTPSAVTLTNGTGLPTTGLTGQLTLAQLPNMAANTVLANATSGSTVPTAFAMTSCSTAGSAVNYTTNTGFGCNTSITAAAVPASGLTGTTLASNVVTSSLTSLGTITSLTATTINAFTLGGTISGGGNQINNVIIGTSTPLAGSFTTLTASTSVTSPLHIGGSAAASTLTLESTSGAGTTDAILFKTASQIDRMQILTGGQVNVGPNVASAAPAKFTINNNTVAPSSLSNMLLQLSADNANGAYAVMDGYGGNGSLWGFRTGQGSAGAFTASLNGDSFGLMSFVGAYAANTFALIGGGNGGAFIGANATENWSATNQGTRLKFFVTPNTTAAISLAMILQNSGGLTIGGTTDPGAGGLQINAQTFAPNMASDTATADSTVCTASSGGKFLKGTGALGICLGTSGAQFKTAFAPMVAGLDEIAKMKFQNYRYRAGYGDDGASMQYGVTAQDVETVLPDLVRHNESGEAINFDSGALLFIGLRSIQQMNYRLLELETKGTTK